MKSHGVTIQMNPHWHENFCKVLFISYDFTKNILNFSDFFFGHLYRNERIPNNINNIFRGTQREYSSKPLKNHLALLNVF